MKKYFFRFASRTPYWLMQRAKMMIRLSLGRNIKSFMTLVKWTWRTGLLEVLQFAKTDRCGYICGWTEPYGFVPEVGCPIHDIPKETFWNLPEWIHYKTLCELRCHIVQTKEGRFKWVKQYNTEDGYISIVI